MSFKLPIKPSVAAQKAVAFLAALAVLLQEVTPFVHGTAAVVVTSALVVVAAISGFIKQVEPVIDDLDKFA